MIWEFTLNGFINNNHVSRRGQAIQVFQDNIIGFKALDNLKPVYFYAKNCIDENKILDLVVLSWKHNFPCPIGFRPQINILNEIIDNLEKLSFENRLAIIKELRNQRIIDPLLALKNGSQDKSINWSDIGKHCILDKPNKE